ncbi:MAG: hypothetical protein M1828_004901 [Chrysothrix sp. TS-e1954]|nr:MAG: hypothetical protein M1828_004901 [Chrysothrix sp. TS-e1954]
MSDTIHIPGPASSPKLSPPPPTTHIILIPGNPGLAEYYRPFLRHLNSLLNLTSPRLRKRAKTHRYTFTALTLAGFETESSGHGGWRGKRLFDLAEQTVHVKRFVDDFVSTIGPAPEGDGARPRIVLVGHSIGAYLLLQHLKAHLRGSRDEQPAYDVVGGICLFPTIMDMSESPNGRRFGGVFWLLSGWLGALVALLACLLTGGLFEICVGRGSKLGEYVAGNWQNEVEWGLSHLMGLGITKHREAVVANARWLRSGWGVWETLYLGRDEMRTVTTDRWDDLVWGSAASAEQTNPPHPKLFFYFGQNDHWVADRTRDELMSTRGWREDEDWRPRMELAEAGVDHAFILRDNETVAEKVAEYVRKIVEI